MSKINILKSIVVKVILKPLRETKRIYIWNKSNIYIAPGSYVHPSVKVGNGTRINNASHIGECTIGNYCAIGGRLVVRSSDHHVGYLNMQEFLQNRIIESNIPVAGKTKGMVKIGHGVWIGDSVIILSGVNIGNGAVIGAGSVVTKSIPEYAIAVGNPARVIKYRFSNDILRRVKEIKWWSWSAEKMAKNKFIFELDLQEINSEKLDEHIKKISG